MLLAVVDLYILRAAYYSLVNNGPSVVLLFGFEVPCLTDTCIGKASYAGVVASYERGGGCGHSPLYGCFPCGARV